MNREYHQWWSPHLNRKMELLVFGHAGAKVLVFPTRNGRFFEYEKMRMVDKLQDKIDNGQLQLFCVDSIDSESYYCFWAHPSGRIKRHLSYEEYILREVLPFMNHRNQHPCTISHGCSLGAFHAANMVFRHPHLFQKLIGFREGTACQPHLSGQALSAYSNLKDSRKSCRTESHRWSGQ